MIDKKLQLQYNLLFMFCNLATCAVFGYLAVFLLYHGLSNTQIGTVTGLGSLGTILLSPFISGLVEKIPGLTIKKMLTACFVLSVALFVSITYIPMPVILLSFIFIIIYVILVALAPFFSMMCMNYIKKGIEVNFGVARGLGSVGYAVAAVLLGRLVEWFNPNVLAIAFIAFSTIELAILFTMPDSESDTTTKTATTKKGKQASVFSIIKKYRIFFMILVGFAFQFAASATLGTYLINIVTNLGGTTTLYGIIVFLSASSEMPIMSITHGLLKKFSAEQLLAISTLGYILHNFMIALAPNLPILIIGALTQGISYGLFIGVITYYIPDHLDPKDELMGQTLLSMMTAGIGCMAGNMIGGALQDTFGLTSMFMFAMAVTIIGSIITFITLKQSKKA